MPRRNPILPSRGRALRPRDAAEGEPVRIRRSQLRGRPLLSRGRVAPEAEILDNARRQAEALRTEAAADAAALREGAGHECANVLAAAREQGQQAGYLSGQAAAQEEMAEALQLVRTVAADTKALRDTIFRSSQEQLLRLVAATAVRVVGDVAKQHPDLVLRAVEEPLQRSGDQRVLRVRVHPDSQQIVEASYGPEERDWALRSDGGLALGGCIVDTAAGVIDASVEGQVGEIEAAWRELS